MGRCLFVFRNEFRRYRTARRQWQRAKYRAALAIPAEPGTGSTPASVALGNLWVIASLEDEEPRTKVVVALTLDGYSQSEIAELLGTSERAIEGILYRWRKRAQKREEGEGSE
jgi:DNA-directed RNA polymerase specialized sigma24 family protein